MIISFNKLSILERISLIYFFLSSICLLCPTYNITIPFQSVFLSIIISFLHHVFFLAFPKALKTVSRRYIFFSDNRCLYRKKLDSFWSFPFLYVGYLGSAVDSCNFALLNVCFYVNVGSIFTRITKLFEPQDGPHYYLSLFFV